MKTVDNKWIDRGIIITIMIITVLIILLSPEKPARAQLTPGSYVNITGDRLYVGIETPAVPTHTAPYVGRQGAMIPVGKSAIHLHQISLLLHPTAGEHGFYECLFLLSLSPDPDGLTGASQIFAHVVGSNGEVAMPPATVGYTVPLGYEDNYLIAEVQAVGTVGGMKCEMQATGGFK